MRDVFRIFRQALKDFWDEIFLLTLMNIITMLPLFLLLLMASCLSWLLGVTDQTLVSVLAVLLVLPVAVFPPALAGLWNAANLVAQERAIHWSDYLEGFRRYFWKAWGLALFNISVLVIALANFWFYSPGIAPLKISQETSMWIRTLILGMVVLWLIYQMYPMAMLLEQEDPRLRLALRNSALLFLVNPGFTLVLALLLLVVSAISTVLQLPWFLFTLSLIAVVCNKAVRHLLEPYRERMRTEREAEEESSGEEQPE
jgi:hypothetical protein